MIVVPIVVPQSSEFFQNTVNSIDVHCTYIDLVIAFVRYEMFEFTITQ